MIGKLLSGAAATVLAALDSPATGSDIVLGKEAYNSNGDKITGTLESINNPWKPSSQSEYDTIVESKNKVGNYIEYSGKTTKVMPEVLSGTFAVGDVVETVYFDTTKSPYLSVTSWDVENVNLEGSTYVRIKYLMVGDETVTISGTAVKKGLVYISDKASSNNYLIYDTTKSLPLYVGGTGWGITQGWLLDSTTFEDAITLTAVESNPLLTWNGTWAFKVRVPQYAKEYFPKPTLTNEGTASDLAKGKQLINSQGTIVTGTAAAASENKLNQYFNKTITEVTEDDLAGLTSIPSSAFIGRSSLMSVTIPNSVTSIGYSAFRGCSSLTDITIPNSVTSIDDNAFQGCSGLTSVTISNNVTSIDGYVFQGCSSLTSITIPNGVMSIDGSAFSDCSSLTSVTIPNSVGNIYSDAFKNCRKLQNIYISDIAAWCNISGLGYLMVYGSSNKKLYINNELATSTTIPNSVTSIGDYAFRGCSSLTSITIPGSVTSIGFAAFSGCTGLTSITIPDSVTAIKGQAFFNCTGFANITLLPATPPTLGLSAFDSISSGAIITVPKGTLEAYKAATNWSKYADKMVEAAG